VPRQGVDIVAQRFDRPGAIERYLILALVVGFSWRWCWRGVTANVAHSA
jgi:hypothetical protein